MRLTPEILSARAAVNQARTERTVALEAAVGRPGDRFRAMQMRQADQRLGDALADFFSAVTAQIDAEAALPRECGCPEVRT